MIKAKRETNSKWKTNPFAKAWKEKLSRNKKIEVEEEIGECQHVCSGNCRRVGCNCDCGGEWHCLDCGGTGIIEKDVWTGTDDCHQEVMSCHCTQD